MSDSSISGCSRRPVPSIASSTASKPATPPTSSTPPTTSASCASAPAASRGHCEISKAASYGNSVPNRTASNPSATTFTAAPPPLATVTVDENDILSKRHHQSLDHLGSPRYITDGAGNFISEHKYYPFGEEATRPAQDELPLKFTGHERDFYADGEGDDLDYMHARFCDPRLGQFLSVDPVLGSAEMPQSWNRYVYVQNQPLVAVDPDGMTVEILISAGALMWDLCLQQGKCSDEVINVVASGSVSFKGRKPPVWIPMAPEGVDIFSNMATAEGKSAFWFYEQVRNKGPWDFKQQGSEFEAFGYFHYGATGSAAGFSWEILERMAGWAQTRAGPTDSGPSFGEPALFIVFGGQSPYGDEPADTVNIRQGYRLGEWYLRLKRTKERSQGEKD